MKPVVKGTSFVLVHTPNIMTEAGTTFTLEKAENKNTEFLQRAPEFVRSYEQCVGYPPNPEELENIPQPWYEHLTEAKRFGKFGEIMPEDEFYGLMQIADVFDLVWLEESFAQQIKEKLSKHPLLDEKDLSKLKGKRLRNT